MRFCSAKILILALVIASLPTMVFGDQEKKTLVVSLMGNSISTIRYDLHFGELLAKGLEYATQGYATPGRLGHVTEKKIEGQLNFDKYYEDTMEKYLNGRFSIYDEGNKQDLISKIRNKIVVDPLTEVRPGREFKNEITPELKHNNIYRLVILAPHVQPGKANSTALAGYGVLYDYSIDKLSTFISAQASAFESSGKLIGRSTVVSISKLELLRDYSEEERLKITQFLENTYQSGFHKTAQNISEYRVIFEGRNLSNEQRSRMQQKFDSDYDDLFGDSSTERNNFAKLVHPFHHQYGDFEKLDQNEKEKIISQLLVHANKEIDDQLPVIDDESMQDEF